MKRLIILFTGFTLMVLSTSTFAQDKEVKDALMGNKGIVLAQNDAKTTAVPEDAVQQQTLEPKQKQGKGKRQKKGKWNKNGKGKSKGMATPGGRGHHGDIMGRFSQVWRTLDLNEDQRKSLFGLQQKFKRTMFENQEKIEEAQFEMMEEFRKEKIDDTKLDDIVDQLASAHRTQIVSKVSFMKEMRSILNEEQLKKLHGLLSRIGGRFISDRDAPPPPPK